MPPSSETCEVGVHRIDAIELVGIGEDLGVVVAARRMRRALLPALAAVGGAEEAALVLFGFDDRVENVRVLQRVGEADPADLSLGQPGLELAPALAAVDRLVEGRLGTAADQRPDMAPALVRGGVDRVRVARVEQDVGDPGLLADREHPGPGLAEVDALVDAALAAAAPERTVGRHPDDPRVARIDQDAADVLGLLEPHALPRLAAVERAVEAVAVGDAALVVVLAGADPDDVGVLRVDGQGADRIGAFAVEDRRPGGAGVGRLPDAAGGRRRPTRSCCRSDRPRDRRSCPEVRAGPIERSASPAKVALASGPFVLLRFVLAGLRGREGGRCEREQQGGGERGLSS